MKKKIGSYIADIKKLFKNRLFQIILVVFFIDRITKIFAVYRCPCVVAPFLNIVRVSNRGIAFGMLKGPNSNTIFIFTSLLAAFLLYYFGLKRLDNKTSVAKGIKLGITFMIAGALGNIVDRIFFGFVLDIFSFHLGIWYFPAFNIADVSVTFGAIVAIIYSLFEDRINSAKKKTVKSKTSEKKKVAKKTKTKIITKSKPKR